MGLRRAVGADQTEVTFVPSATRVARWPIPQLLDVVGPTPEEGTRRADVNEIWQDGREVAREVFFGRHELRAIGAIRVPRPCVRGLTGKGGAAAELLHEDALAR